MAHSIADAAILRAIYVLRSPGHSDAQPGHSLPLMRTTGLEPARLSAIDPKSIASANSAMSAHISGHRKSSPLLTLLIRELLFPHETSGARTRDT